MCDSQGAKARLLVRAVDESLQPDTSGQLTSPGAVGQALQAAGYFSKGFPPNLATNMRPAVGDQILRLLESALHVPQSARSWKDLVRRAAAFAHRTVETLGERALPGALRMACVLLGPGADATDIREAISLANQLVMRFKGAVSKLMAELLPLVAARVAEFLPSGFDWSGADTTAPASSVSGSQMSQAALSEEQREWGDIQKAFYSALNCLATQDLGGVLLELVSGRTGGEWCISGRRPGFCPASSQITEAGFFGSCV